MRAIRCRSFLLLRRDGVWDEYHGRLILEKTWIKRRKKQQYGGDFCRRFT